MCTPQCKCEYTRRKYVGVAVVETVQNGVAHGTRE